MIACNVNSGYYSHQIVHNSSDAMLLTSQNVVVAMQPTAPPPVTAVDPQLKQKPVVMIVTIVLTAACLVQGNWPALVCLTPALIAAVVVSWMIAIHYYVINPRCMRST